MVDERILHHLGWLEPNNPEGRWFPSKHKFSFLRFYDTGFREVIHNTDDGWVVSIGHEDGEFQLGYQYFDTTREAKEWADTRGVEDLDLLSIITDDIKRKLSAKKPQAEEVENPGF